jgi:hypothetical protein
MATAIAAAACPWPAATHATTPAGTSTTTAIDQAPSQRATTIDQNRTGDSQVSENVPDRTSAPTTASPRTRQPSGSTSEKMPTVATWKLSAGSSPTLASRPKRTAPAAGSNSNQRRRLGTHARRV